MNILEARRRLLDGEIKKRTAEGENISVRSVSRMRPALTIYGKSEQETTTGAQLFDANTMVYDGAFSSTGITDIASARTAVIPIEPGVEYSISRGNLEGSFFRFVQTSFNNDITKLSDITVDTFIDGTYFIYNSFSECIITADSNAKFLLIYIWGEISEYTLDDILSVLMMNVGSTILPWEPYTGGAPSPSPGYPQEIKSVGDSGTINVSLSDGGSQSQILPVQTPNGLPGIPVSSGGNYTDANGQQWMCDEIDFKREVYIKRINYFLVKADVTGVSYEDLDGGRIAISLNLNGFPVAKSGRAEVLCTRGKSAIITPENRTGFCFSSGPALYYYNNNSDINSAESFISWVSEHQMSFLYQLSTPVETPLRLRAFRLRRTEDVFPDHRCEQ